MDIQTMYGGYYCDMGRMAVVGKPSAEQTKAYQDQLELKRRILEFMRPGRTCAEVHAFYLEQAKRMGLKLFVYPYLGAGHTTGVNNDEFPKLNAGFEGWVLEPGMIFDVEPDTIGPEGEVMHSEDMVLVTTNGVEVITQSEGHDWSNLLVIPA
jgi:Xaa-Pro dipeptidase